MAGVRARVRALLLEERPADPTDHVPLLLRQVAQHPAHPLRPCRALSRLRRLVRPLAVDTLYRCMTVLRLVACLATPLADRSSSAVTPGVVVPVGDALLRWLGLIDEFRGQAGPEQGPEALSRARKRHNQRLRGEVVGVVPGRRDVDRCEARLMLDLVSRSQCVVDFVALQVSQSAGAE